MPVGNAITVLAPKSSEVVNIASADYTFTSKSIVAIYIGVSGDVIAQLAGDATARTWKNCVQGTYLLGAFVKVTKVGTTATNLIGVTGIYDAPAGS